MTQPLGMLNRGATGSASGLSGTGYKQVSLPTMGKDEASLHSRLLGAASPGAEHGASKLSQLAIGGPESYEAYEKPALRDFGALTGQLASRFSGMGGAGQGQASAGARKSSGFQNIMGEQGASLAENLASNRMNLQRQAIQDLLGLSHTLMQTPTHEYMLAHKKEKPSLWKDLLGGAIGGLSELGGMAATAYGGPMAGAAVKAGGYALSRSLGNRERGE